MAEAEAIQTRKKRVVCKEEGKRLNAYINVQVHIAYYRLKIIF